MESKKIDFNLVVEEGFPPISVERLNATECAQGQYEILNSPFFITEIAYGDIVAVAKTPEGRLEFVKCIKTSSYKAISIIILNDEMNHKLMDLFRGHNCVIEYGEFGLLKMVAIAIPDTADYKFLRNELDNFEAAETISYAELVV